jgi:serine O-acetyltransferase
MRPAARRKANAVWLQVGDGARLELHHTAWWRHVWRDYRRFRITGDPALRTIFLSQGLWASTVYRLSRAALNARPAWLRPPLALLALLGQKLIEMATGISLPQDSEIGEGLYIGHYGSIIVSPGARIGHNCSLAQNVTVGAAAGGPMRGAPVIGNRVFIGAHSVVVGAITVGDDAMICAGSVVNRSVPARAVMMGNPARVVSYEGSFEAVLYDGMDADPPRKASLDKVRSLNVGPA